MWNIILDKLPTDYNGYLIRTDFRIGMQIAMCMEDRTISEQDRVSAALLLLYGRGVPDAKTAHDGLMWFMRGGQPERNDLPNDNKRLLFYDFDSGRIWASFKATFGIDLHTANMHWFEFCYLLSCLGKDTSVGAAMEIRDYPLKDLKGEERKRIIDAKRTLTPPVERSEDEKEQDNSFADEMRRIGEAQTNA